MAVLSTTCFNDRSVADGRNLVTHMIIIDPQPHPEQVFALATPAHVLTKLYWEIKQLEISLVTEHKLTFAHAPAYHAFNCAITSWHLLIGFGRARTPTRERASASGWTLRSM